MRDESILIRRSIALECVGQGAVAARLEDNFHHFGVRVAYEGGKVTDLATGALRFPWTTCPAAGASLRAAIGEPLSDRPEKLAEKLPMQLNCTHMFELGALAIRHASLRDRGELAEDQRIDMVIRESAEDRTVLSGTYEVNGQRLLDMTVGGSVIASPERNAGRDLYDRFRPWLATLPADEATMLWLMRRAFWLAAGYQVYKPRAFAGENDLGPVCYTYQPERKDIAAAIDRSVIDVRDLDYRILDQAMIFA